MTINNKLRAQVCRRKIRVLWNYLAMFKNPFSNSDWEKEAELEYWKTKLYEYETN